MANNCGQYQQGHVVVKEAIKIFIETNLASSVNGKKWDLKNFELMMNAAIK